MAGNAERERELFRQETLRAWEEFQETGPCATEDEVRRWLLSWGTGHELAAPVPVRRAPSA